MERHLKHHKKHPLRINPSVFIAYNALSHVSPNPSSVWCLWQQNTKKTLYFMNYLKFNYDY